ncbi:MAG TPA: SRPBCC family protein [Cellvibrionaceae bacterium]
MNNSDVRVETEIETNANVVWDIISNFSKWSEWHKSSVEVRTKNGIPILLRTQMIGVPLRINLKEVKVVDGRLLEWKGELPLIGSLLSGIRKFTLSKISESRCTLVQEEKFCGALSGLAKRKLIPSYQCRYNLHNEKIKAIAESKM